MQILVILWEPNARWLALDETEQREFLESLDDPIAQGRAIGMQTLGWSRVDRSLPKAPEEGFVGIFAMEDAASVHALEASVAESGWYDYFDSVNISIAPFGGNSPAPHEVYETMLGLEVDVPE